LLKYHPIDAGVTFDCDHSDLVKAHWEVNGFFAEFALPNDKDHSIRVTFDQQCIVRLLDEMALSTEDDPANVEGLVPNHFAYRVEGATFATTQSETWKEVWQPFRHYQFVTGSGCVDVLSASEPTFKVVTGGN
jgi:hypothetical protein